MRIELLEQCASDLSVVNAARVSFSKEVSEVGPGDAALIRFLMKNRHGSPFEHGYFKFRVEAPIFVFRDWLRHRIGHSYNEMSSRYSEFDERFYVPEFIRRQYGKPGTYSFEEADDLKDWSQVIIDSQRASYKVYKDMLDAGVAKEQAKAVLPVGIYSQMYWSCNPRSLMHFCSLRNAPEAIYEIQLLAKDIEETFQMVMPVTAAAFVDNGRKAP